MNVTLKRHFLLALLSIYAIVIIISRIQGNDLPRQFLVSFPLFSIAFFPPFRFTRERVTFINDQLQLNEGVQLHTEINFDDIASIEGRSLMGIMPILTITGKSNEGKSNERMVLSMKADGVLELEDTLLPRVSGGDTLHEFFRFYRILIRETNALETIMMGWIKFAFLFALVTPVLLWDEGLLPERMMILTLVWFSFTTASAFFVLATFAIVNRIIISISATWADANLSTVRAWCLLFIFFGYLAIGNQFSAFFFT